MAKYSFQAFKDKWAALTGRFRTNFTFDIDEEDYREFSQDIADSLFEPMEALQARVEKLEQPAPPPKEGIDWKVPPKVSVDGNDVKITPSTSLFLGAEYTYDVPVAMEDVVLPPDGFGTRIDILAATGNNNGWAYIYGEEPGVTPPFELADQPDVDLLFAAYLFWTSAGGVVEEPVVFVKTINGQAPDTSGNINITVGDGTPGGGTTPLDFTKSLPFDKNYLVDWTISGATAFTKNALNYKPGKFIKGNIKADGVNRPTFSADFIINYNEYINTAGKQHRVFFEAQADGKISVDIMDM